MDDTELPANRTFVTTPRVESPSVNTCVAMSICPVLSHASWNLQITTYSLPCPPAQHSIIMPCSSVYYCTDADAVLGHTIVVLGHTVVVLERTIVVLERTPSLH